MKFIIILALIVSTNCKAQSVTYHIDSTVISTISFMMGNEVNPKWDSSKYYSICGLDRYCPFTDGSHYVLKVKPVPADPYGEPVYGIQQAYIGVVIPGGRFVATLRRDHLTGKPLDRELLEDPQKLSDYVKNICHL